MVRMGICFILLVAFSINAMEKKQKPTNNIEGEWIDGGPLNDEWFYDESTPYYKANQFHANRQWEQAVEEYTKQLNDLKGTEYDQWMATLNRAYITFFALRHKAPSDLLVYDRLNDPERTWLGDPRMLKENDSLLIDASNAGMGDFIHLHLVCKYLQERGIKGAKKLAAKKKLHGLFKSLVWPYNIEVVDSDKMMSKDCTQSTHFFRLLGYLNLAPSDVRPSKVMLTAPEKCVQGIKEVLHEYSDHPFAVLVTGGSYQGIIPGGRRLKRRNLDPDHMKKLLKKYPKLMLINGDPNKRFSHKDPGIYMPSWDEVKEQDEFSKRVIELPGEKTTENGFALDTNIGLGFVLNNYYPQTVSFVPDMGPGHVYTVSRDVHGKKRTAYLLPDPESVDARMSGNGTSYFNELTGCWVYPCTEPSQQGKIFLKAYEDLVDME